MRWTGKCRRPEDLTVKDFIRYLVDYGEGVFDVIEERKQV